MGLSGGWGRGGGGEGPRGCLWGILGEGKIFFSGPKFPPCFTNESFYEFWALLGLVRMITGTLPSMPFHQLSGVSFKDNHIIGELPEEVHGRST